MKPHDRTIHNAKAAAKLRVGDIVSIKGSSAVASRSCPEGRDNNSKARIAALMDGAYIGGVYLEQDLHGCRYWNADELKLIKRSQRGGKDE